MLPPEIKQIREVNEMFSLCPQRRGAGGTAALWAPALSASRLTTEPFSPGVCQPARFRNKSINQFPSHTRRTFVSPTSLPRSVLVDRGPSEGSGLLLAPPRLAASSGRLSVTLSTLCLGAAAASCSALTVELLANTDASASSPQTNTYHEHWNSWRLTFVPPSVAQ